MPNHYTLLVEEVRKGLTFLPSWCCITVMGSAIVISDEAVVKQPLEPGKVDAGVVGWNGIGTRALSTLWLQDTTSKFCTLRKLLGDNSVCNTISFSRPLS
jgi:hypothetical protein